MYSYGTPHMAVQKQGDQHEHIQQLCEDTGCYPEDLPEAMNDREMKPHQHMQFIAIIETHLFRVGGYQIAKNAARVF